MCACKNKIFPKGFTLMELMVVAIIIGILVTLAVPNYVNTKEKALDKEAIASLRLIKLGEMQHFSKFEYFYPLGASTNILADINGNLSLVLNSSNWAYTVAGTNTMFGASATRLGRVWVFNSTLAAPNCTANCL